MPRRTAPQKKYDESLKRFNLSVWGRQSGKTTAGLRKMLWKPLQSKEMAIYWHILQTHSAADVVFERFMNFIHPHRSSLVTYVNESDKRVELIGGRNIYFKSGENFEDLRTESLAGVIIDEARQQEQRLWTSVIFPMLSKSKGWADLLTTPNGFDWVYDLYNEALIDENWGVIHAPSTEAWWWTEEELLMAKKTMGEAEYAQEIMAEFRDLTSGKAYINFHDKNLSEVNPFYADGIIHPQLAVIVAMDFNLTPMSWTLGQKKSDKFHWFDEIHLRGSHTQEAAKVMCEKIKELNPQHGVILAGDATSKAGQRAAAGQSDYDIVCQTLDSCGIKWVNETPESNPTVKDRVNTVNAKLRSASGEVSMTLNPKTCPYLKKDFDRVVWKSGTGDRVILDQTTNPELTHHSDGVGYAMCALSPLTYDAKIPTLRVIRR